MADPKTQELQTQADLQAQINKVLESRNAILAAQQKALSTQVQLAVDMCKALKCEELDKVEERLKTTRDAMTAAATEAGKLKNGLDGVAGAGQNAGRQGSSALEELNKKATTSNLTIAGFGAGVLQFGGIFMQTFKNVISMAGGLLESLGRLGFAIFTLPFKLLGGLFDLAQGSGGGGPSPTAQALEKIRGELGGLNTAVGKAAASSLPQFRKQLMDMAGTGLSVRKVFGPGREGLAKAMEYNLELFKALGPAAESFAGILKKSAVELAMYRKGLGISAESQAEILKLAEASGKDPTKAMHDFATMAINMGETFGISASVIGKDMAEMKADFANFGTLSVRELGQAAVYARKLGIEVKALQGLVGQFDDFENAAQNAAKLSQAFGMNVDAMKMMQAQNPAERLSMLQQAFRATGKSVESMQRQELKLLATQAGLTEEQAYMAFSQKGLAQSYDQITKAGGKAEKKQLTQAEAMSKLADSIERVFGSGGGSKFQGFFDAFSKGFQGGILRSKELRGLFRDIRKSLRTVFFAGRSVGKMFAELFPGFQQMVRGLRDVFNPARFRDMMGRVKDIFRQFFLDLRTDPKAGVERFVERMKEAFKSLFQGQGSGVNTFMEGGKTFLKTIGAIFMAIMPMVLDGLVKAVNAIADFLENPPGLPSAVSELGSQLLDALIRVFDVLKDRLWPPLKRMFTALWEKVGPYIEEVAWRIFQVSLFKAFVRGVIGGLGGAAIAFLKDRLLAIFKSVPTPPPPAAAGGAANPAAAARMVPALVTFMAAIGVLLLAFWAVVEIYTRYELEPQDALAIGAVIVALAGSAVMMSAALKLAPSNFGGMITKVAGLALLMYAVGKVATMVIPMIAAAPTLSSQQLLSFMGVMTTLVLSSIPLLVGAAIIGQMQSQAGKALIGMGILAVFMVAIGVVGTAVSLLLNLVPNPSGVATLMTAISLIMLSTMLMLPAALALGLMAGSPPFGTIGLAAIVTGFAVIGGLATEIVGVLVPAITALSRIRISNPQSFKAVTEALVSIMQAVNGFVLSLAGLALVLRPTGGDVNPNAFRDNIDKFGMIVDTILNSGVMGIMNRLMEFTQTAQIKEGAAEAVSAIASVLGSVAQLMQAFAPDGEILKAIATEGPGLMDILMGPAGMIAKYFQTKQILDAMKEFQQQSIDALSQTLPIIVDGLRDMLAAVGDIPPSIKDVGPFLQGFSSILTAVTSLMNAIMPSNEAWKTLAGSTNRWVNGVATASQVMNLMREIMSAAPGNLAVLLNSIKQPMIELMQGMMSSMAPLLSAAAFMDPQVLSSLTQALTGVISFVGSMTTMFTSMMDRASEIAGAQEDPAAQQRVFRTLLRSMATSFRLMGSAMGELAEPMRDMVQNIINIAAGISNSRGLKAKVEAVVASIQAVAAMAELMKNMPGHWRGEGSAREYVSGPQALSDFMRRFTEPGFDRGGASLLFAKDGTMQRFVNLLSNLVIPRGLAGKAEGIKSAISAVSELGTAFSSGGGLSALAGDGALASTLQKLDANMMRLAGLDTNGDNIFDRMAGLIASVPRVADRMESINNLISQIGAIQTGIRNLGETELTSVVELTRALNGNSTLTVQHENVRINLSVNVNMSAKDIARGILEINNTTELPNERFSTVRP
jgi:hypothetical protein